MVQMKRGTTLKMSHQIIILLIFRVSHLKHVITITTLIDFFFGRKGFFSCKLNKTEVYWPLKHFDLIVFYHTIFIENTNWFRWECLRCLLKSSISTFVYEYPSFNFAYVHKITFLCENLFVIYTCNLFIVSF